MSSPWTPLKSVDPVESDDSPLNLIISPATSAMVKRLRLNAGATPPAVPMFHSNTAISDHSPALIQAKQEIASLKARLNAQNVAHEREKGAWEQQQSKWQLELQQLNDRKVRLERERQQLFEKHQESIKKLEVLESHHSEIMKKELQQFRLKEDQLYEISHQHQSLKESYRELENANEQLKRQVDHMESQNKQLLSQLQSIKEQLQESRTKMALSNKSIPSSYVSNNDETLDSLQRQLDAQIRRSAQYAQRVDVLEAQLRLATAINASEEERPEILKERVRSLTQRVQSLEASNKRLISVESDHSRLLEQLKQWQNTANILSANVMTPQGLLELCQSLNEQQLKAKETFGSLSAEHRVLQDLVQRLTTENACMKSEMSTLQSTLKTAKLLQGEAQSALRVATHERDILASQLALYDGDANAEVQLRDLTAQSDRVWQQRCRDLEQTIAELKQQQLDQANTHHSPIAVLQDALKRTQELLESEKSSHSKLRNDHEELLAHLDFDPRVTRILHLRQNPFNGTSSSKTAADTELLGRLEKECADAQKRLTRLKEVFQEQITDFRATVFALLGFRIDLEGPDHVKLTSLYAFHSSDTLEWRRVHGHWQLLDTPYSRSLTSDIETYLTRGHAPPALMASVTLNLWGMTTLQQ